MHLSVRILIFAMLVVSIRICAADDPLIGTWKLNAAQSKYSPGPPPRSATVKFELYGEDGVKLTRDEVDSQGKLVHSEYTAKYDGKDYPVQGEKGGGNPPRQAISARRIDAYTTENINKNGHQVTSLSRRVVSKDGKKLTITVTGTDAKGQPINNVVVYDRQ